MELLVARRLECVLHLVGVERNILVDVGLEQCPAFLDVALTVAPAGVLFLRWRLPLLTPVADNTVDG